MVCFWLYTRIEIIKRHLARDEEGATLPPRSWGWLVALAKKPWISTALFIGAAVLGGALVATWPGMLGE